MICAHLMFDALRSFVIVNLGGECGEIQPSYWFKRSLTCRVRVGVTVSLSSRIQHLIILLSDVTSLSNPLIPDELIIEVPHHGMVCF
jgi:hypothetical protein